MAKTSKVKKEEEPKKKKTTKKVVKKETKKPEVIPEEVFDFSKEVNKKRYFSLKKRLLGAIILFFLFLGLCVFFVSRSLIKEVKPPIKYTEKGKVDYKVYLKENEFYSEKYLPKNKSYIASIIDYIDIDLNYTFNIDALASLDFDYKVIGNLVIENDKKSSKYLEKEYVLLDSKEAKMTKASEKAIKENIIINYDQYNELANKFKSSYGIDTNSYLKVYLEISKKTTKDMDYEISEKIDLNNITIPLSQKAIEISIDSQDETFTNQVPMSNQIKINKTNLALEITFLIAALIMLKRIVDYCSLVTVEETEYDKYVKKILRDYDRLIVEVDSTINFNSYNVHKVNKFTELLDVRDNLKVPINYYNISKHEKGIFYIKSNDDIYVVTIKNVDLIKEK